MVVVALLILLIPIGDPCVDTAHAVRSHGGIVRMDTTRRVVYLVFTGHEFAEGGDTIRRALHREGVKASFFFTGDFYRTPSFHDLVTALHADGHYLGPHSDKHLLYATWEDRDSLLVGRDAFLRDLGGNYAAMESFGIRRRDAPYFLPAYEWYNDSIAAWSAREGVTLVNFTGGTSSNADYTFPDLGSRYVTSDTIMARILRYERENTSGLNGFLLLTHIGVDPARPDKFYDRLPLLIAALKTRGYTFRRLGGE